MKARVILAVLAVIGMGFIMPLVSENVVASTNTFHSEDALDGFISSLDNNYPGALAGAHFTTDTTFLEIWVGQTYYDAPTYIVYNGYLSFNTSILSTYTVTHSELYCWYRTDYSTDDFSVEIHRSNFGDALTDADWGISGTFEGTLLNTDGAKTNAWYSTPVSPELINTTGRTQYVIKSSNEGTAPTQSEIVTFFSANSTRIPYLYVTAQTDTGATVTYNFSAPGMTNCSTDIWPVSVIDWNNTHEQVRYEVYLRNESYAHLQLNNTYEFQSAHTCLNVTVLDATTGLFNLTDSIVDFEWFHIWFLRPKAIVYSHLHIRLWHSTLGDGVPNWKFKCVINSGNGYNNTSATWVYDLQNWQVEYGSGNYTISVLDYFGNHICNYSFSANALDMNILIPIDIPTLRIVNYRQDTSHISIYFNAVGNPFTQPVTANELYMMPIRASSTSYMFMIKYLDWINDNTTEIEIDTYFYNLTISADTNFYISDSLLLITYYDINGIELTLTEIQTTLMPGVIKDNQFPPCVEPFDGTRASLPLTTDEYILRHPFVVVEADVNIEFSGVTTADFWDPRPSTGSTIFPRDILHISAPFGTNILLNYTNGTNFANFSHIPAPVDITQYGVQNFTYWSNHTSNLLRTVTFRSHAIFYWHYESWISHYYVTHPTNNTTPFDWTNVYWAMHFYIDAYSKPDIFSATVYDNDNDDTVEIFEVKTSGIRMRLDWLNSTAVRTFTYSYYEQNATQTADDARIFIKEYQIREHHGKDYWMGGGSWENPYTGDYDGKIWIVLENLAGDGDVLSSSVEVYDENGDSMTGSFVVLDDTIQIFEDGVGTVGVGETKLYTVYFQYKTMGGTTFPLFTPLITIGWGGPPISLYTAMFGFIILFFILGIFIEREQTQKLWFVFSLLCMFLWMIGGGVCWAMGVT